MSVKMELSQSLRVDQRMQMVLAPRMIQSMEILQLPMLALQERIKQELESNPVLEIATETPEQSATQTTTEPSTTEIPDGERDFVVKEDSSNVEDFERLSSLGPDFSDFDLPPRAHTHRPFSDRDPKMEAMANTAARDTNLDEYLRLQWSFVSAPDPIKKAGELVISFIDDDGYLRVALDDLPGRTSEPVAVEDLTEALSLIQTLDPPGTGARNIQECLLLQLPTLDGDTSLERELILNHLDDIRMNRYPAIARKTHLNVEQIDTAVHRIARIEPAPGHRIGQPPAPYIVPDVIIEYDPTSDSYQARLADDHVPNLAISEQYRSMFKAGPPLDAKAKEFLQRNIRSARWLIEAIQQRRQTLMRVVNTVIKAQRVFLDNGPQYLKPLPMLQVAEQLGIHVATVSRAVSDKYAQTPRGIFSLRSFFSGGTQTASGEVLSWNGIKAKLMKVIEKEDKQNPLSDDQIVAQLKADGLKLARRTIAKYRKVMNIPPARRRRQFCS